MEIEEVVIRRGRRPGRITLTEISIIVRMIRKPNSIIVIHSKQFLVKNIAKTCLPLLQIADVAPRVVNCLLAVLAMFLAIISPSSYS